MKQEDIFNAMGIDKADQEAMLKEESNVSLFKDAISKTHITRLNAVNDETITGAAVKSATDKFNKSHQAVVVEFGKSIDVAIDPNTFIQDGVFDIAAFNTKATTDFGTAITALKDAVNGDADEKFNALKLSFDGVKLDLTTTQGKLEKSLEAHDQTIATNKEKGRQRDVDAGFDKAFSSIKFDDDKTTPLFIKGLRQEIKETSQHRLNENNEYVVTQLDGSTYKNAAGIKELSIAEIFLQKAVEQDAPLQNNSIKPPTPPKTPPNTDTPPEKAPSVNKDVDDKITAHIKAMELSEA